SRDWSSDVCSSDLFIQTTGIGDRLQDCVGTAGFYQNQQHRTRIQQLQTKNTGHFFQPLTAGMADDGGACCSGGTGSVQHLVGFLVIDEDQNQFKLHAELPDVDAQTTL